MMHYAASVHLFGSLDSFNTELPEWLHINYAKKAYRASNKRNYVTQMTTWLQRQDSMFLMESYLSWSHLSPSKWPVPHLQLPPSLTELYDRDSDKEDLVNEMVRHPKEAPEPSLDMQHLDHANCLVSLYPSCKITITLLSLSRLSSSIYRNRTHSSVPCKFGHSTCLMSISLFLF